MFTFLENLWEIEKEKRVNVESLREREKQIF